MFSNLIKTSIPTNFIFIPFVIIIGWWSIFINDTLFLWNTDNSILFSQIPNNLILFNGIGFISIIVITTISLFLISFTTKHFHGITGNVLPTVIFLIISSQLTWVTTQGISLFTVLIYLFIIQNLFQVYHQDKAFKYVFNAGFLTGVSIVIYLPSVLLLIASWLTIILLKKFNIREFLTVLLGAFLPLIFTHVLFLFIGKEQVIFNIIEDNFRAIYFKFANNKQLLWILFFIGLIIWSFVITLYSGILKKIVIRSFYYSFVITLLIYCALLFSVFDEKGMLAIVLIPASYMISFSIAAIRKKIIANIVILLLIFMQIFVQLHFFE